MKKLLHLRFLSVIMLMLCGIGRGWADDQTVTFQWNSSNLTSTSGTVDGITFSTGKTGSANATVYNASNGLVLYGVSDGGGYFQTTKALSGEITKVTVVANNKKSTPKYTVYGSNNGSDWTQVGSEITVSASNSSSDFNFTGEGYTYVKIANTTNATAQLGVNSIKIYYAETNSDPTIICNEASIDEGLSEYPFYAFGKTVKGATATLTIKGKNLDDAISYQTVHESYGETSPFEISGELTSEGGTLTVTVAEAVDDEWFDMLILTSGNTQYIMILSADAIDVDGYIKEDLTYTNLGFESKGQVKYQDIKDVTIGNRVYGGNMAENNNDYIQLRSNGNSSGIVTKFSNGYLRAMTIEWNEQTGTTSSDKLDIYANNLPYSRASELYSSDTSGKNIGQLSYQASNEYTHIETIAIDGDVPYIGLRSNNGALYINKITLYWEPVSTELRVVDNAGLATFCSPFAIDVTGKKAYIVETVGDNSATLTLVTGVVAPGTGLMINAETDVEFNVVDNNNNATAYATNYLKPAFKGVDIPCTDGTAVRYVYGKRTTEDSYAFHKLVKTNMANNKGNLAYLEVPVSAQQSAPTRLNIVLPEATAINSANVENVKANGVYNLNGQKVSSDFRGIVIVNGKKIVK